MVIGTGVYIESPTVPLARGGLLAVASVVDLTDPHAANGITYLSENCGVNSVVQGDNCAMGSVTISQTANTLTVTLANVPTGVYTFGVTGETSVVDSTSPYSASFDITGAVAPITVTVTSTAGLTFSYIISALPLVAPVTLTAQEKTPGQIDVIQGDPFLAYRMVECLDLTDDDTGWARTAFGMGEAYAVEEGFWRTVLAQPDTTIVSGTGIPLLDGIALAERYAASVYGGIPTLHMDRGMATFGLASMALENSLDWTITTRQGSLVANGGGYDLNTGPTGLPAAAGTDWLYVTGYVTIGRTPLTVNRVLDHAQNSQQVLAERTYIPLVDCFKAAILIDLEP
jgi:hypothetical protein